MAFRLSSLDQLKNFREAVWFVDAPLEAQVINDCADPRFFYSLSKLLSPHFFPPCLLPFHPLPLFSPSSSSSSLQPLGSLSSNGTFFTYDVPTKEQLENEVVFVNNSANITAKFTLLQSEVSLYGGGVCVYVCHEVVFMCATSFVCMCVMRLC